MNSTNQEIKYFVYCRKSTEDEDRQVLSLDSQENELKELVAHYGLKTMRIFRESKSAKEPYIRPVFTEMIARIQKGEAQGIICWKVDRLSRNPIDSATLQWLLQKEIIRSVHTVGREYKSEDNSIIFSVESSMANEYIRQLSKNVKRGLKAKLGMGWYPSRAPLGYKNSERDEDKGRNWILKDPERYDAVRRMWDLMLTGNYTPPQIVKMANDEWKFKTRPTKRHVGLKPLSRSNIYKVFTNPFYYGWFEYGKGENRQLYQGKHESMITAEEYDRVQKLLGRHGRPRSQKHRFAFTGLMRCGNCDAMITAEEKIKRQKNGNIHQYIYYRCTKRKDEKCQEKAVELDELSLKIDKEIEKLTISEKFKDWAIKYLHEIRQTEAQTKTAALDNRKRDHSRITQQLASLLVKYSAPENSEGQLISESEYQGLRTDLLRQKAALEATISVQNREIEEWLELSERTFNFARYARIWFTKGDLDTKRAIFACLGSHLVIKDQKVAVTLRPVFKTIFEALPKVEREITQVRTYPQLAFAAQNNDKAALDERLVSNLRCVLNEVRMYFELNPDSD